MATEHKRTFYLQGGKTINTLKGFAKELVGMPKEIYEHHVNNDKNDFSAWIKHSLGNESLAKRIDGQISKIEIELEVLRHIVHEEQKKTKKKPVTKKVATPKKTSSLKKKTVVKKAAPVKKKTTTKKTKK